MLRMKPFSLSILLLISLLISCSENKSSKVTTEQSSIEQELVQAPENNKLMDLLDHGKLSEAHDLLFNVPSNHKDIGLLLFDCSNARYDATTIIDDDKTITLQGRFWIRSGDSLIDGMPSDDSYAIIHKRSMRVIKLGGEYEMTRLLNN